MLAALRHQLYKRRFKTGLGLCMLLFLSAQQALAGKQIVPGTVNARILTSAGPIEIELYAQQAPLTVANFLRYMQDSAFDGGDFYRVVRADNDQGSPQIAVIQGRANPSHQDFTPLPLETTALTELQHLHGTLSMAMGEPDSATQEFFICIGAQPALDFGGMRNPDGQGFAAFGQVTKGMQIVKNIHQNREAAKVDDAYVAGQILAKPVKIMGIELIPDTD